LRAQSTKNSTNDVGQCVQANPSRASVHGNSSAQDQSADVRREAAVKGEELDYIFMIRVGVPGGRLTTDQWLALGRRRPPTLADAR